MKTRLVLGAMLLGMASTPALAQASLPGVAGEPATHAIAIHAVVKTICRVDFAPTAVQGGRSVDLGTVDELCNDPQGSRMVLVHPAGLKGAMARVDGVMVPLSESGQTVLVNNPGCSEHRRNISLVFASDTPQPVLAIAFRMEPRGVVY